MTTTKYDKFEFNPNVRIKWLNGEIIERKISKPQKIALIQFLQNTKISDVLEKFVDDKWNIKMTMKTVQPHEWYVNWDVVSPFSLEINDVIRQYQQWIIKFLLAKKATDKELKTNMSQDDAFKIIGEIWLIWNLWTKKDYIHHSEIILNGQSLLIKLLNFWYIVWTIQIIWDKILLLNPHLSNLNKTHIYKMLLEKGENIDEFLDIWFENFIEFWWFISSLDAIDLSKINMESQYVEYLKILHIK